MFEDEPKKEENKEPVKVEAAKKVAEPVTQPQSIDDLFDDLSVDTDVSLPGVEDSKTDKPKIQSEEDTYDLQKELEAKFDELFGPLDEE